MIFEPKIIDWLLDSDPSIQWQVYNDLLDDPIKARQAREEVLIRGWGKQLMDRQDPEGTWAKALYSPKWISTTYTLLLLRRLGALPNNMLRLACEVLLDIGYYQYDGGINYFGTLKHSETCVTAMILTLCTYFQLDDDRTDSLLAFLLNQQMDDGGWNCQSFNGAHHSSFHTTISALESLFQYSRSHPKLAAELDQYIQDGLNLLLQHRLFFSDHTGEIINKRWTLFSFPPRWYYDVLRALDFAWDYGAEHNEGYRDAIELLHKKRRKDGTWRVQNKHQGQVYFDMEKTGRPSRWNTLRALRVLRWWEG